jgi:hypothetical protein
VKTLSRRDFFSKDSLKEVFRAWQDFKEVQNYSVTCDEASRLISKKTKDNFFQNTIRKEGK